jgi:hypothetical protein
VIIVVLADYRAAFLAAYCAVFLAAWIASCLVFLIAEFETVYFLHSKIAFLTAYLAYSTACC